MPRPLGAPNKPKRKLLARLEEDFPEYHPVAALAEMVHCTCAAGGGGIHRVAVTAGCVSEVTLELAAKIHSDIAGYVEPKRSAIKVNGDATLIVQVAQDASKLA